MSHSILSKNENLYQLHAIGRTHMTSFDECGEYASSSRAEVCRKRAETMTLLNGNDEQVFR